MPTSSQKEKANMINKVKIAKEKLNLMYMTKFLAHKLFKATTVFVQDNCVKNNGRAASRFQQDSE